MASKGDAFSLIANGGRIKSLRALIQARANIDARASDAKSPLHFAAGRSNEELTKALLSAGANPKAKDSRATTPMMCAARKGLVQIAVDILMPGDESIRSMPKDAPPWRSPPRIACSRA